MIEETGLTSVADKRPSGKSIVDRFLSWLGRSSICRNAVVVLGAVCPFGYLVYMIVRYTIDAPYLDEWIWIPYVEKTYLGTLTLRDLWEQHNEHRLLFPKILTLLIIRLSKWRVGWLQVPTLLFSAGIASVVMGWLAGVSRRSRTSFPIWTLPVAALIAFSLNQWEIWFMGMESLEFMNPLAVLGGFMLLVRGQRTWGTLAWAAALGVVASYSRANGLGYWPVGLALVWACNTDRSRRVREVGAWCLISAIVLGSYFYDYHASGQRLSPMAALRHPLAMLAYGIMAFGAPVVNWQPLLAGAFGAICVAVLAGFSAVLVRRDRISPRDLAPFWAAAAYVAFTCGITALGRIGLGDASSGAPPLALLAQGMSSRYLAYLNLPWYGVVAFMGLYAARRWTSWPRGSRMAFLVIVLAFVGLLGANSCYGTLKWTERYRWRLPARAEVLHGNNEDILQRLYPDPAIIFKYRGLLESRKLSLFREGADR